MHLKKDGVFGQRVEIFSKHSGKLKVRVLKYIHLIMQV